MAPRPKQEYEERPPDEDGTPFERFERALKKVFSVPKGTLDERGRESKLRRDEERRNAG